jgi:hypothetical protein
VGEKFVIHDGTDHSSVERRIENVMRQLDAGRNRAALQTTTL